MRKLSATLMIVALALPFAGCRVEQTEEGEMPEVEVDAQEGELPEYDVDAPDVEIEGEEETVTVPDVDVETQEEEVTVPDVDVEPPAEGDQETSPEDE